MRLLKKSESIPCIPQSWGTFKAAPIHRGDPRPRLYRGTFFSAVSERWRSSITRSTPGPAFPGLYAGIVAALEAIVLAPLFRSRLMRQE